jgi:hypothetical protein
VGPQVGAYRTGIATLLLFALAAVIAMQGRIARALPHALAQGTSQYKHQHNPLSEKFSHSVGASWSIKPKTWQRLHIVLAISAMLPLWWHCDLGRASPADLMLKTTAILLVISGFFGIATIELLPGRLHSARLIKGWFAAHRALCLPSS